MADGQAEDVEHWRRFAAEWIAWARSPGETFGAFRAAFAAYVGDGSGRALDVGCGEGRISRVIRGCGFHVTAVDPVADFVAAAKEAGSADRYELASATDLPFDAASFDLVVAYNVLMDVADVPGAVRECRRVLRPSGTLILSIVHPFIDRGRFAGPAPDAPFVVEGGYFERERFEEVETHDGFRMHFAGWSLPLEAYAAALADAGLAITSLVEPRPANDAGSAMERWRKLPLFLWLKARPFAG